MMIFIFQNLRSIKLVYVFILFYIFVSCETKNNDQAEPGKHYDSLKVDNPEVGGGTVDQNRLDMERYNVIAEKIRNGGVVTSDDAEFLQRKGMEMVLKNLMQNQAEVKRYTDIYNKINKNENVSEEDLEFLKNQDKALTEQKIEALKKGIAMAEDLKVKSAGDLAGFKQKEDDNSISNDQKEELQALIQINQVADNVIESAKEFSKLCDDKFNKLKDFLDIYNDSSKDAEKNKLRSEILSLNSKYEQLNVRYSQYILPVIIIYNKMRNNSK